jgi:hypothetical protein
MTVIPLRQDGYMNLLSGLNTPGLDRSVMGSNSGASWRGNLERYWLSRYSYFNYGEIYYSNGLAQKIIDRPADDCLQQGMKIEGDEAEVMRDEFDRLCVNTRMGDALRWSRLYGGSALLLIAKDGGLLTDPLNLDRLEEITEIQVYDITCIKNPGRYYDDMNDPDTYGKVEYYTIAPPSVQAFDVHETRLIPIGGEPVPVGYVNLNGIRWGGRPVLEGCMSDLMRYGQSLEWALRLLERKQQAVYQMNGLGEMFANGDDALVQQRINMVDLVRGNLNSVVVDKDDAYTIQNLGMDGVQSTIEEYQNALAASSNIPKLILFGQTMGGLHTTGSSNLESYYSMVSHIQEVIARPALEKLVSILYVQKTIKKSDVPDTWHIEFNPLWMPTGLEQAQTDQAEATADQLNINNLVTLMNQGILSAEEVRKVVVNDIYGEYDFDDALPSDGGDINYAEGIDTSLLQVAAKKNSKGTLTTEVQPNAAPPKA